MDEQKRYIVKISGRTFQVYDTKRRLVVATYDSEMIAVRQVVSLNQAFENTVRIRDA